MPGITWRSIIYTITTVVSKDKGIYVWIRIADKRKSDIVYISDTKSSVVDTFFSSEISDESNN